MRHATALLIGLLMALAVSQFPEYSQQYVQRLGGAVDELRAITAEFDAAALGAGLTRDQAMARYAAADDSFLVGRAASMNATFARYTYLNTLLTNVQDAPALERAAWFPQFFDPQIASRTLASYQPALPITLEGLGFAGAGFLIGYLLTAYLFGLARLIFGRRRRRDRDAIYADTADY